MAAVTRFEDLQVWQMARALNSRVFLLSREAPLAADRTFVYQFRRASLSVMNNIAEGFERFGRKEFLQFLSIAKGSLAEVRSMLYAAADFEYLERQSFDSLMSQANELASSIGRFRSRLARNPLPRTNTKH